MARKDALLRLTSRLIARRDALRKALNGDLDSFRRFSELNAVGDNVDAAVDSANDEICSQLVEIESVKVKILLLPCQSAYIIPILRWSLSSSSL